MRRVLRTAMTLLVLSAMACGGTQTGRTMTVVGTEMAFDAPDTVKAGTYTVTFRNDGAVYHELAFRGPDGEFAARRSIAGGEQAVLDVTLKRGTWELGCFEPGHYEMGMRTAFTVTD